jgi:hypothetical protein
MLILLLLLFYAILAGWILWRLSIPTDSDPNDVLDSVLRRIGLIGLLGTIFINKGYHYYQMRQSTAIAEGVITEYDKCRKYDYCVSYRFVVAGVFYEGSCQDSQSRYADCKDTKGCLGKRVKIIYAEVDPSENELIFSDSN